MGVRGSHHPHGPEGLADHADGRGDAADLHESHVHDEDRDGHHLRLEVEAVGEGVHLLCHVVQGAVGAPGVGRARRSLREAAHRGAVEGAQVARVRAAAPWEGVVDTVRAVDEARVLWAAKWMGGVGRERAGAACSRERSAREVRHDRATGVRRVEGWRRVAYGRHGQPIIGAFVRKMVAPAHVGIGKAFGVEEARVELHLQRVLEVCRREQTRVRFSRGPSARHRGLRGLEQVRGDEGGRVS